MRRMTDQNQPECRQVQTRLAEYAENALSARESLEVERHLTSCPNCAQQTRQMQATLELLHQAPRLDTGSDFMAKLHARLDNLEPEQPRRISWMETGRELLAGWGLALRTHRVSVVSLSLAAVALFCVFYVQRPLPETGETEAIRLAPAVAELVTEPLRTNVALAASNPFEDLAAANLAANTATKGVNGTQE